MGIGFIELFVIIALMLEWLVYSQIVLSRSLKT